jgi:hypothetical protein
VNDKRDLKKKRHLVLNMYDAIAELATAAIEEEYDQNLSMSVVEPWIGARSSFGTPLRKMG